MPAFKVNCIMHRNNPILAGAPPEGSFLGENAIPSASLWRELDKYIQGIKGVRIVSDAKLGMVVISLKQMYAGHAKSAALCAAGLHTQSEALRWIIVVDDDIEPFNTG
jgi:UbiD family decarboxylase